VSPPQSELWGARTADAAGRGSLSDPHRPQYHLQTAHTNRAVWAALTVESDAKIAPPAAVATAVLPSSTQSYSVTVADCARIPPPPVLLVKLYSFMYRNAARALLTSTRRETPTNSGVPAMTSLAALFTIIGASLRARSATMIVQDGRLDASRACRALKNTDSSVQEYRQSALVFAAALGWLRRTRVGLTERPARADGLGWE
jgi:hypothetical protein